jgi:hypothetical protein
MALLFRLLSTALACAAWSNGLIAPSAPQTIEYQTVSDTPVFTTGFDKTENPISDGALWHHTGKYWAYVRTAANHAVGTQTGSGGYDDSYAYLSGFGPDQRARATLWRDPALRGNYQEVELLLRWADTATTARGYECNLSWDGSYAEIVRWNGPFGDFTYIAKGTALGAGAAPPKNGDIFKAAISGSTINVYLNRNDGAGDRLIVTGTDKTYTDGNPGMGFFIQGQLDPARFGFSGYAASSD